MFSERDKQIFRYELSGLGTLYADPLAVYDKLMVASKGRLRELLATQGKDKPESDAVSSARATLAGAARLAFLLPPFDPATGNGTLDDEAIGVLDDYLGWLKKNGMTSRPAASPTLPARTPGQESQSLTKTSSDCGCS